MGEAVLLNPPWWVDLVFTMVFAFCAGVQYWWITEHGHSAGRWLQALGWTVIVLRWAYLLITQMDVHVSPIVLPALTAIAVGTIMTAIKGR